MQILNFYKFEMWKIRFKKMQSLNRLDSHRRSQCVPSLYQFDRGVMAAPVGGASNDVVLRIGFRDFVLSNKFGDLERQQGRGRGRVMDDSRFRREKEVLLSPKLYLGFWCLTTILKVKVLFLIRRDPDYLFKKQIKNYLWTTHRVSEF